MKDNPSTKVINEILNEEWDPLGVRDIPGSSLEYYSYAQQIASMLKNGTALDAIALFLQRICLEDLERVPDKQRIQNVILKIQSKLNIN